MSEDKVKELTKDIQRRMKSTNRWLSANKSIGNPEGEAFRQIEIYELALAALTQPASPALKLPWSENTCRECRSKSLSWGFAIINKSTVQNGLLRISDVDGLFYLGCDECSETVAKLSPDEVVDLLSALQKSINIPHTAPIEPICATGSAEWVKIEDEPPRDGSWCIAIEEGNFAGDVVYWGNGEWRSEFGRDEYTHWMYHPAAPES